MVSATFTGQIIARFEDALSAFAILTAYIPMLMDTGGNCGSPGERHGHPRSVARRASNLRDIFRVIWKEIRVAVLCGATLAASEFRQAHCCVDTMVFGNPITITVALVICLTLVVTVFAAKVVGCIAAAARQEDRLRPRGHGFARSSRRSWTPSR